MQSKLIVINGAIITVKVLIIGEKVISKNSDNNFKKTLSI